MRASAAYSALGCPVEGRLRYLGLRATASPGRLVALGQPRLAPDCFARSHHPELRGKVGRTRAESPSWTAGPWPGWPAGSRRNGMFYVAGCEGHGCCLRRPLVPMIGYARPLLGQFRDDWVVPRRRHRADHWTCWPRLPVRAGRRGQHSAPNGSTLQQHCRWFRVVTAGARSQGPGGSRSR